MWGQFFRLFIIALSIAIAGCADNGNSRKHKQRQTELQDRLSLRASFEPLVGIYDGEVSNAKLGEDPFPIIMEIFIGEEPDGINEEGELVLRPELRAWYMRLDQGKDNTSSEKYLIGRYYSETSALSFVSQSRSMGAKDAVSIAGVYRDHQIIGEISNYRGVVGELRIKKRLR